MSSDGSQEMVKQFFPNVNLISLERRVGIGEALNIGISKAYGGYIVIDLNNDDIVSENWLNELMIVIQTSENIGIVGGKRYLGNTNKIDSAGGKHTLGLTLAIGHGKRNEKGKYNHIYEVDYMPVFLIKKEVLNKIGLLDTEYFIYGEDVDLCLRAKIAGYKILYVPKAEFRHMRSATVGESSPRRLYYIFRSRLRLMVKFLPLYKLLVFLPIHIFIFSTLYYIYYAMFLDKDRRNCLEYFKALTYAFVYFFLNLKRHFEARARNYL